MEADYDGFSIRAYTRKIRSVQVRKCWPFSGDFTGDLIHSLLPPITVSKFRWWSHELASLLAKSPVAIDDSEPPFRRKARAKSRPCKKRSIVEIFAAAPEIQLAPRENQEDDSYVLNGAKRKRTQKLVVQKMININKSKDSGDPKFANKVNNKCKEQAREKENGEKCSLGIKESSGVMDSAFQIPGILKVKRKVCSVTSPDYGSQCERHVMFSDQSGNPSQLRENMASLELCCSGMNRLSLSSSEDHSYVNDNKTKVMLNDQTSAAVMHSETQLSQYRGLSCFPGPHLSSQDLERKGDGVPLIESFISSSSESPYRGCSSSSSSSSSQSHCGTLLYQSPFEPLVVEWMQNSVVYRQRHVEEAILGVPLHLPCELVEAYGEGCRSFDRSGLVTGSSTFAENDHLLRNLVEFSSGEKHSIEPALAKDSVGKRHKYFPARLGVDEIFTEKAAFFISDTNDGECVQTVGSPVSEVNPRSHTINLPKQDALNQNLSSRSMVTNRDGLCLHNNQATMRLMGKDVSVGTSYSDMVRTGEDASVDYSYLGNHTHQSWQWRKKTLGISENHSMSKNWNGTLLGDTSKEPFPLFCEPNASLDARARTAVVLDSEFPPAIPNPYCSFASFPLSDKDISFHGSNLRQPNSFTFSQQQLPFSSNCNNADIGLVPDARKPYFGLPFSYTDPTRQSHWPQNSYESSHSRMSLITPAEQLVSFYGSKSSSYINVGKANKPLASVEEYPTKNQKIHKFPIQGGLKSEKEFFCKPAN